jgi:putative ABC transport system ATP-binding protein
VPRQPIIQLTGVELTLNSGAGAVNILRGIDLAVDRGAAIGIVGPSGSGKSTMMAVMTGLERPTGGCVIVDGVDISGLDEDKLALFRRGRVGIVLQSFHLMPTMTALENVAIPLELSGRKHAFERARAELDLVGLGHRTAHYPAELSGGEQQRVALARALVSDPALLFADEPTGNLDSVTGDAIIKLMFDLHARRGTTMLLITHDSSLASRCNRILHLADGRIMAEEPGNAGAGIEAGS